MAIEFPLFVEQAGVVELGNHIKVEKGAVKAAGCTFCILSTPFWASNRSVESITSNSSDVCLRVEKVSKKLSIVADERRPSCADEKNKSH